MSGLLATQGFTIRSTCTVCLRRRMCKLLAFYGTPGLAWMVCREHGDWRPVEGEDYEVGGP